MVPIRLLLVEDEALLAMDLQDIVEGAGHHVVGASAEGSTALDLAQLVRPDLAFVDLSLRDGFTGPKVGLELARQGIHVLFVTANAAEAPLHDPYILGVIAKPYSRLKLTAALAVLGSHPRENWPFASGLQMEPLQARLGRIVQAARRGE